ncbi:MAG: hypothetical protein LJE62_00745 [Silicimonas sp.]|jgi:iron-sulfur cluster repair protein YtfE (RIC family)|nr:hypothetical protein [Silicimonas sp.]
MYLQNVVVLCPKEAVSLEPLSVAASRAEPGVSLAEDAVEEMVVCLAAIEAAWTVGEFSRMAGLLASLHDQAMRAGLPDVVDVSEKVERLLTSRDEVALAAVVARLIRVGETSLATLLEISYRQN